MSEVTVTGWTSWKDSEIYVFEGSGIGFDDAFLAVVKEMKAKGYRFSGPAHQNDPNCVPVLNGGVPFMLSLRMWGAVMASVLDDMCAHGYVKWAFRPDGEEVLP